ncbi:hypothetical protein HRbin16_01183 [bacterium HR16]|nr:hypothetical protein HRbin16_01183 [bacterium HR16]
MSYPRGGENPPRIRFAAIGGAWALYAGQWNHKQDAPANRRGRLCRDYIS